MTNGLNFKIFESDFVLQKKDVVCLKTALIASHLPQKVYLVSIDLLHLFMRIGLAVAKVHNVYEFD